MRNLLFKFLLAMLCFSVMLFALVGCDQLDDIQDIINGTTNNGGCDHEYSEWELFADGECQARIYKHVCSKCQDLEWKEGTDADHKWDEVTVKSTCDKEGGLFSVCSICKKREVKETLPLTDHVWKECIIIASCQSKGFRFDYCTICGDTCNKELIPALTGHEYIMYNNLNYHYNYCKICDVRIDVESHSYNSDNKCSVCGREKPV